MLRVGHKGADALVPGNTLASFERAVEAGVDVIEFDVLRVRSAHPGTTGGVALVVAHDYGAAADAFRRGDLLTLDAALEAFTRPPLDRVGINLDLKLPGAEDQMIDAVRRHGLLDRVTISTMEVGSLGLIGEMEPGIGLGWTIPRVTRDWLGLPTWTRPVLGLGLASVRARMPGQAQQGLEQLPVESVWAFFGVVTPKLVSVVHDAGRRLIVWTVDEPDRIERLRALGVDGIVSNDPDLLS